MEGIAYACQRHQSRLPNGDRCGFFIGDSAGVGKGRQIAGILMDNFFRGRNKHVWFSTSGDLVEDARRDLRDLGCTVHVHDGCGTLDKLNKGLGMTKSGKSGVLFSTYSTLVSSKGKIARYQQIVDWVGGKDFEGCLVFDECHKAKNFSEKESSGSRVAKFVIELQRELPNARCVYVSATGVTNIGNLAYMERLGLWGENAPFASFKAFEKSMGKRNLGALEMLAMELKGTGMHVSRGLSYREATFEIIEADLTLEQAAIYKNSCEFWMEIKDVFRQAEAICKKPIGRSYGGCHQRFFRQLCVAFKIPSIVSLVKTALSEDKCVVIGLQSTGEAAFNYWLSKKEKRLEPSFLLNLSLVQLIETALSEAECIHLRTGLVEKAMKLRLPVSPIDDLIFQLGGKEKVSEMTGRTHRILPGKTGLSKNCSYEARDKQCILDKSSDSLNIHEKNDFMSGKKYIAIISGAASTGISLHADKRAKNQRRRVHITCELAWAADAAIQQLGRSHRASQVSAPEYMLLASGIGGENRFVSAVASRLKSLGALTHGDRRASSGGISLSEFDFNTHYGQTALQRVYDFTRKKKVVSDVDWKDIVKRSQDAFALVEQKDLTAEPLRWDGTVKIVSEEDFIGYCIEGLVLLSDDTYSLRQARLKETSPYDEKNSKNVKRFLNRLLGCSIHVQALLFNYFACTLDAVISSAKRDGVYDEGVSDIVANSITCTIPSQTLYKSPATGGELVVHTLSMDRGLAFQNAIAWAQEVCEYTNERNGKDVFEELVPEELEKLDQAMKKNGVGGFYESRKLIGGQRLLLLALRSPGTSWYAIARPNTGRSSADKTKEDLERVYKRVSINRSRSRWENVYKATENGCVHGPGCSCTIGTRFSQLGILSGSIMGQWPLLQSIIGDPSLPLQTSDRVLRIVRAELDNGSRVIGIRWPSVAMNALRLHAATIGLVEHVVQVPRAQAFSSLEIDNIHRVSRGIEVGSILYAVNGRQLPTHLSPSGLESFIASLLPPDLPICAFTFKKDGVSGGSLSTQAVTPVCSSSTANACKVQKTIASFFKAVPEHKKRVTNPTLAAHQEPIVVEKKTISSFFNTNPAQKKQRTAGTHEQPIEID
mmetsp:Transcript_37967/g.61745  ORF Transcript_37967/g.61745 Transcript_37967/m.61745 type:complete len:1109 (+) Transcript_37967:282-3608(+)